MNLKFSIISGISNYTSRDIISYFIDIFIIIFFSYIQYLPGYMVYIYIYIQPYLWLSDLPRLFTAIRGGGAEVNGEPMDCGNAGGAR